MFSVRNAIISAVLLLILAIGTSLLSMTQPPDSGGMGADSFGNRGHGHKALYDTLTELDVTVTRNFSPPVGDSSVSTMVFLSPSLFITATEPTYISHLREWVESGGRIVTAPAAENSMLDGMIRSQLSEEPQTFLDSIGLSGITVVREAKDTRDRDHSMVAEAYEERADSIADRIMSQLKAPQFPTQTVDVRVTGDFPGLSDSLQELSIPLDEPAWLQCSEPPVATVQTAGDDGEPQIHAARFPLGDGEIIVLADPYLFSNRLLAQSGNSLLAVGILSPDGQNVQFDEFYHGLGVRGQPLYLLTRGTYATITLAVLFLTGIVTWRRAVFPGPPLADDRVPRRDITEYVTAMARFFSEGGQGHARLLQEMRDGLLRETCLRFGLPPDTTDADRIIAVAERKDPACSERLREAVTTVDSQLQTRRRWSESQTLEAMQRMSECL